MSDKKKIRQFQSPKGMHDILPEDQKYWKHVAKKAANIVEEYGFQRIDPPIMEEADLYVRSVGEGTDIVDKEMFNLKTKGGDLLSLRPEFTAGIVRSYIENGMSVWPHPVKLYSIGPVFRHDQPQAGRYRQFHQLNLESFGSENAVADAELILIAYKFLESLGIKNVAVKVNSIGDAQSRGQYIKVLKDFFRSRTKKLCAACREKVKITPLRVFDCKEEGCKEVVKEAPLIIDYLDQASRIHFKSVLEFLDELNIGYMLDPMLVRGLDYYTKTVFEIFPESAENENLPAIIGGGRYDKLVEFLGGPKTPAAGWAAGLERIIMHIKNKSIHVPEAHGEPKVFVAQLGEAGKRKGLSLFDKLRQADIRASTSLGRDSIKSQLRIANRLKVKFALIIGQKEALDGTIILRDMDSGIQEIIPVDLIIETVKKRLKE